MQQKIKSLNDAICIMHLIYLYQYTTLQSLTLIVMRGETSVAYKLQ
jgi:hypothetical protein